MKRTANTEALSSAEDLFALSKRVLAIGLVHVRIRIKSGRDNVRWRDESFHERSDIHAGQ